ncbi:MAG: MptD family putative ECF transporter S component [Lachnospiraceae bacterium]|nr:MptD family putative ECF transporter S component [Lachnospiraceae bacterium]MDY4069480.1 MptD family putative ECF transporter S component [Lachnospiraceae bacterium]
MNERKKRLNARDLITLGIFNAIAIVCYAIVVALVCTTVMGLFFSTAAAFLVLGTVYMVTVAKVRKRGTYFVCGLIMSVVGLIGGRIFTTVGCIAGGVIAELLVGDYTKVRRIILAYCSYAVAVALGIYLPAFMMGAEYIAKMGAKRGMTLETAQSYMGLYTPTMLAIVIAANIVGALAGALIGRKVLKKHFIKAGLVK